MDTPCNVLKWRYSKDRRSCLIPRDTTPRLSKTVIRQTLMDNFSGTKNHIKVSKLASDNDYYNHVFKKTENIVSVIFYILSIHRGQNASRAK